MRWVAGLLAAALVLVAGMGNAQPAPKRVALIVANSNYAGAPLPNTTIDAGLVRETLARAGFASVELKANQTAAAFRASLAAFQRSSADADVALVYFAGHGVEAAGRNWLIPIDANLTSDADLQQQAIDVGNVFAVMAGARTRIAVLDACRNNPFEAQLRASGSRTVGRGLGAPNATTGLTTPTSAGEAARGAMLMYSAAPGAEADDGPAGQGSPFARAFQKYFAAPDVELRVAVGKIADAVSAETSNRQIPFSTLSLSGDPIVFMRSEDLPVPTAPNTAGAEFRDCSECPLMVVVPAGNFMMGSPETEEQRLRAEGPQRSVEIAQPFAVGKYEVTFAEWDACVAGGGCVDPHTGPYRPIDLSWGRDRHPVIYVSWQDAQGYVRWLNRKIGGRAYRLLSEAEWEYSARAGTTTPFSTGASIAPSQAQYAHTSGYAGSATLATKPVQTAAVGSFEANGFKLHDMHGNVWEWVEDCYRNDYSGLAADSSAVTTGDCLSRVNRGGSWFNNAADIRSAIRIRDTPSVRNNILGFRVARTL